MLVIDQQMVLARRGVERDVEVGVLLEFRHFRERHEDRAVDFAGLQFQHAGVVVNERNPLDAIELHPVGLPEIRVLLEDDAVAAPPFHEAEGAGSHGLFGIGFLARGRHCLLARGSKCPAWQACARNGAVGWFSVTTSVLSSFASAVLITL